MKKNVRNSLDFMLCARSTLNEIVSSSRVKKETKKSFKNFIMNEASDYEVISLLVEEKLPKKKYDFVKENELFQKFNTIISHNENFVKKTIGKKNFSNLLEVSSLIPYNLSSNKVIMEFAIQREQFGRDTEIPTDIYKQYEKYGGTIASKLSDLKKAIKNYTDIVSMQRLKIEELQRSGSASREEIGNLREELARNSAKLNDLRYLFRATYEKAKEELREKTAEVGAGAAAASAAALKAVGVKTGATGIAAKIGVGSAGAGAGAIIGGLLGAALLTYGAYKTYQRFFSKAAKACRGKNFKEKTACLKSFRLQALEKQLTDLRTSASACMKTKDPRKCSVIIAKKIKKLESKITKLKRG